jgi:hypothetical protein
MQSSQEDMVDVGAASSSVILHSSTSAEVLDLKQKS